MAEQPDAAPELDNEACEDTSENYKAPAEVSLAELIDKDADDESLARYKKALLGEAAKCDDHTVDPDDMRRVILTKLTVITAGRPDQELDLSVDKSVLKRTHLAMKEGVEYQVKISFYVQREIVSGLKYVQATYRKGIRVDKSSHMVGSYAPSKEERSHTTRTEEAPKGIVARGTYSVKSVFTDDDKNKFLEWEWSLDIVKDWKD